MFHSIGRSTARAAGFVGIIGVLVAAMASPADAVPAINFAPAVNYATGGTGGSGWHETGSVSADFNNDGKPDVAVADYFASNSFRVMLNQGNGTFPSPGIRNTVQYGVGTLLAGDVNEDGKADIVASNVAQVYVLRGNGNGTFTLGASYTIPQGGQEDAQLGDFNNDANIDVAVLTRYGVNMLLGNGNGTFTTGPISPLPSLGGSGIDDARLNSDGFRDVVVSDGIAQVVYALRGNGNGSFTLTGTGVVPGVPGTVLAGDFNEDGIDDAVALDEFTYPLNGAVLLSNGSGGFGTATRYDAGFAPVSGELADLNNDGNLDIVSCDTVGNAQVILAGDGAGGFTSAGSFPVATFPQTPVVADFNNDGRTDIATAGITFGSGGFGTTQLSVLRNIS